MRTYRLDELALMPEDRAVQRHFDSRNYRVWRVLAAVLGTLSLVLLGVYLSEGATGPAVVAAANLAALAALWLLRRRPLFARSFRPLFIAFVLVEFALAAAAADADVRIALGLVLCPLLLLFVRLRSAELVLLAAAFAVAGAGTALVQHGAGGLTGLLGQAVGLALPPAFALSGALLLTRRDRRDFVARWREAATRERDRLRMRDELADARRIQLAMLPESPPQLDWLEVSGSSLPANEVGGDFYDYLELPDGRLVVVVGDVAGHGVSSGLVLAAVKGGLHLLRDELASPEPVFRRLDRMVREVVRWRVIVTLLVAVLDPRQRRMTVVSAGHPPALHLPADGGPVRSVGRDAPPLGTRLEAEFRTDSVPLAEGDAVLWLSDGATELCSAAGELYGFDRLARALEATRRGGALTAQGIREAILNDLSRFKADTPQRDDITLVAARLRSLG